MDEDPFASVTLVEASRILGVATSTLRHQIRKGALAARKVGRDWVVDRSEVDRYARNHSRRRSLQQMSANDQPTPAIDRLPVLLMRAAADLAEAGGIAARGRRSEALGTADRVGVLLEALVRQR